MPVAKGPDTKSALLVGVFGVVFAVAIGALVLWASGSSDKITPRLGDDVFDAGLIGRISRDIGRDGPLFYPDPNQRGRDIWLTHLGDDPEINWFSFEALVPGGDDGCLASWTADTSRFVNLCDETDTYPPDGTGLTTIPVTVEDGHIIVNLNRLDRSSDTTDADSDG